MRSACGRTGRSLAGKQERLTWWRKRSSGHTSMRPRSILAAGSPQSSNGCGRGHGWGRLLSGWRWMPFVDAAKAGGAGRSWIVLRHILPFAMSDFMEALPLQALSVAAMIGKLGVVRIFVGGTTMTLDPVIFLPAKGEWLGLLGYYYPDVAGHPWLFLAPFCGWILVLACVGLLAAGAHEAYARSRRIESLRGRL